MQNALPGNGCILLLTMSSQTLWTCGPASSRGSIWALRTMRLILKSGKKLVEKLQRQPGTSHQPLCRFWENYRRPIIVHSWILVFLVHLPCSNTPTKPASKPKILFTCLWSSRYHENKHYIPNHYWRIGETSDKNCWLGSKVWKVSVQQVSKIHHHHNFGSTGIITNIARIGSQCVNWLLVFESPVRSSYLVPRSSNQDWDWLAFIPKPKIT